MKEEDLDPELIFGTEGCLNDILPWFTPRVSQLEMARFLKEVFVSEDNHALVEAGTGTGKTLAYLIPALYYCLKEGVRLAVSTETRSLQQQLIDKDIPALKKIFARVFDLRFNSSICLGSTNYPCRRKYESVLKRGAYKPYQQQALLDLADRMKRSPAVHRNEIIGIDGILWNEICRDSEHCLGRFCEFQSDCVYQKAREEWESSTLLVMNHALLCTNLQMGRVHLPMFSVLIVDEAHSFPGTAARQFGFELNSRTFPQYLRNAYELHNESLTGLFTDKAFIDKLKQSVNTVVLESQKFFGVIFDSGHEQTKRIRQPLVFGADFLKALRDLISLTEDSRDMIPEEKAYVPEGILSRLADALMALVHTVEVFDSEWVYWCERDRESLLDGSIVGQPVEISGRLQADMFGFYRNIVFTSATLSTNSGFTYIAGQLGLSNYRELRVESPFDYERNMRVYIPNLKYKVNEDGFAIDGATIIAKVAEILGGRTLVLCTSYRMMNNLRKELEKKTGLNVISQSDEHSSAAIKRFREQPDSILLGVNSFWQGIDLQGSILQCVVVTQLPFAVPDRPDIQAVSEKITARGGNAFRDFQLPEAVIRFKQGIGRLIRSEADKGLVLILDKRVSESNSYGRVFLQALPARTRVKDVSEVSLFLKEIAQL